MFKSDRDVLTDGIHKYTMQRNGQVVRIQDVFEWWIADRNFREFFNSILVASPFSAFRWETPPVTNSTVAREFEFVLLDSPDLIRTPDRETFAEQMRTSTKDEIAVFDNLGGDARLVVPAPSGDSQYDQLANFVRNAPPAQMHSLWKTVGHTVSERLTDQPLWLSTAGGGVAWLHVRLDTAPKYYAFSPYRSLQ